MIVGTEQTDAGEIPKKAGNFHVSASDTHASHMLAVMIYPQVVRERLGHSSIAITMDIYTN